MRSGTSASREPSRLQHRCNGLVQLHGIAVRLDCGGYMLIETNLNYVAAGADFDLDLDDVERFLAS
jgi:hypothetical protein